MRLSRSGDGAEQVAMPRIEPGQEQEPIMTAEDIAYDDDDLNEADIVEWYEARPIAVSTAVATGSIIGAFALGVLTAVGALALLGYMDD